MNTMKIIEARILDFVRNRWPLLRGKQLYLIKNRDDYSPINISTTFHGKIEGIEDCGVKLYININSGLSTDTFCLGVTSVRLPQGRGNDRGRKYNTFNEECIMRRGIVTINNKDNLCLPRALVVAIANVDKGIDYKKIRDTKKIQTQRVNDLLTKSKIRIPAERGGIPEIRQFQDYLKDYKVVVYQYGGNGAHDIIFEGENNDGRRLNLLYNDNHYNVITSLTSAFCCNYFCQQCHQPYNNKNAHRCGGSCPCCQQSPPCSRKCVDVLCESCNRSFRGEKCYNNHLTLGSLGTSNVWNKVKRCLECLKVYIANKTHICGEFFCKICNKDVPQGHLCFIQPDKGSYCTKDVLFVFYDLETRQEKVVDEKSEAVGKVKLHEPNLCVFSKRCDICIDDKNLYFCQKCGYRVVVYRTDVIHNFMKYLLDVRKTFKKVVVLAHNGQAFDHQFIINYIFHKTNLKPELIMRGTKIIMMQLNNIKSIDSLNYFSMALSKLP